MDLANTYIDITRRVDRAWRNSSKEKRSIASPVLIAVSKGQSVEKILTLYQLGHRDFGENYVQEFIDKKQQLEDLKEIRWHFIGHLQSNKAKQVANEIFALHSLDRIKLAQELNHHLRTELPVFIEVNTDLEAGKSGVSPSELEALLQGLGPFAHLNIKGLMAIPAPDTAKKAFQKLAELAKNTFPNKPALLSMGMSDDFENAIAEGATHIRVGTALFGQRCP